MATRQYIGARYVPKFYDYNGSPNWREGVEYEALSIVTRNGNSYTSKKPVPSNIGEPENNPEYWVATGLYNQQVEAYRQLTLAVADRVATAEGDIDTLEGTVSSQDARLTTAEGDISALDTRLTTDEGDISDIETRIDNLTDDVWLIISDSYGTSYANPDGVTTTIFDLMRAYSGKDATHLIGWGLSGQGFVSPGGTFLNYFNNHINDISNKNNIKKVIVVAGRNDWRTAKTGILSAMETFANAVKNNCPNAQLYCGYIAIGPESDTAGTRIGLQGVYEAYIESIKFGYAYLNGCENILHNNTLIFQSDLSHPNYNGKEALARGILNAVINGSCATYYEQARQSVTLASGIGGIAPHVDSTVNNDVTLLQFRPLQTITFTEPKNIGASVNTITIGTIATNTGAILSPLPDIHFGVFLVVRSSSASTTTGGTVKITKEGNVILEFYSYTTVTNCTAIDILALGNCTIPTVTC